MAQREHHSLDGSDENPGQASIEDDVKQNDFGCRREQKNIFVKKTKKKTEVN